jgi:CubicO group peptidase (beta-lactamase class C family)
MASTRTAALLCTLLIPCHVSGVTSLQAQSLPARADSVLRAFVGTDAPGCAAAVDSAGTALYRGAFGLAELEYQVPITVQTIFEAGSVSKQFTAAAVLLLEARGRLSLDDPVQKWFPELPQYEWPVTIRHLMNHTSGMRDWGSVIGLTGWPRWTASYNHDDALAIIARQRHLNYQPGSAFGYTNTGYNLMAMLVERISSESLSAFMQREFFTPLDMTSTSWRDDYTRVVRNRAQAYARRNGEWHLDMPFENVYGNGGLLTTVDDLLRWTSAVAEGRVGSPDVSQAMRTSGRFNDGRAVNYGGGIYLTPIRGVPSFNHSGSTAGYRAMLAHFPEHGISAAVLCNRADADAPALNIAMLSGAVPFRAPPPAANTTMSSNQATTAPVSISEFVGSWHSDEAGGSLQLSASGESLTMSSRPGLMRQLTAVGQDAFTAPGGVRLRFERDATGRPTRLHVTVARVADMVYLRN